MNESLKTTPIPSIDHEQLEKSLPTIQECGEPLLPLSSLSPKIRVQPHYALLNYPAALVDCYLRETVCRRLIQVAENLPRDHYLVVFDGWRPLEVQKSIYDQLKNKLLAEGWTLGERLDNELFKYVATPVYRPEKPLGHLTGGAVDLTIGGPDGLLNMGTEFDDFTERANTRYFEELSGCSADDENCLENRRWLYHLMIGAGFVNYHEEWWHYDYGNIRWAQHNQTVAQYGGLLSK